MPERRTQPRRKTVLPVKVSVGEATQLAHTVDITYTGARLGGLRTALHPGETVILQRGSQKARCRVAWVRQVGPSRSRMLGAAEHVLGRGPFRVRAQR
jgi:hypothetical protein